MFKGYSLVQSQYVIAGQNACLLVHVVCDVRFWLKGPEAFLPTVIRKRGKEILRRSLALLWWEGLSRASTFIILVLISTKY